MVRLSSVRLAKHIAPPGEPGSISQDTFLARQGYRLMWDDASQSVTIEKGEDSAVVPFSACLVVYLEKPAAKGGK